MKEKQEDKVQVSVMVLLALKQPLLSVLLHPLYVPLFYRWRFLKRVFTNVNLC